MVRVYLAEIAPLLIEETYQNISGTAFVASGEGSENTRCKRTCKKCWRMGALAEGAKRARVGGNVGF